jgi:lipoprotein NlpI
MLFPVARCLPAVLLVVGVFPAVARPETADEYLKQARAALVKRDVEKALHFADKAVEADPKDAGSYLFRGQLRGALDRHAEAVADFNRCLELDPNRAEAYDLRGSEQFKLGKIRESLADFDRFLKLRPDQGPGHWRRGISLYYAGRYDEGRKQFAGYEKVDTNDVENAVWHFLCAARADGLEQARPGMLKIGKDRRVPMMEVYDLFRGRLQPADVLAAAREGAPPEAERKQRLFYAHLYLGLYYDATGDRKQAREHLDLAAGKYRPPHHYMGDVAAVHRDLLHRESKPK